MSCSSPERHARSVALAVGLLALLVVLTAWLGDDCYFTLRTVDNLLHGHGAVWNVGERVQAYTHPLWMLVLTAAIAITGEDYLTTLVTSMALSVGACVLLARSCATPASAVLVVSLAALSRAFVDYSTGGLENALSFLVFALFFRLHVRSAPSARDLCRLAFVVALAALTRLDTLLVYLPALAWHAWRASARPGHRPEAIARVLGSLALGFVPLLAWELFSLLYYGFPFPNTAYAKLGSGIPRAELWVQGLLYLRESLASDPVTLSALVAGSLLPLRSARRDLLPLSAGNALYCAYVVQVGGDFMSGRFLALPFFVALALLGQHPVPWRKPLAALPFAVGALAFVLHRAGLALDDSRAGRERVDEHGIADERVCYYARTGLLRSSGRFAQPAPPGRVPRVVAPGLVRTSFGMTAYAAGPGAHVLEDYGLGDALLARLPARYRADWRIGHFKRFVPAGYASTLVSGRNEIEDRQLARYYDVLRQVLRGPLLDRSRLRAIVELNLGRHDHLVDRRFYRFPELRVVDLREDGSGSWSLASELDSLPPEGVRLVAGAPFRAGGITLELARGRIGRIALLCDDAVVWEGGGGGAQAASSSWRVEPEDVTATALWLVPLGTRTEVARVSVQQRARSSVREAR